MPKTNKDDTTPNAHWVFLADPTAYGWDDLVKEGEAVWDGIKNPIAQRRLSECQPGDAVLLYHTAPDKALMGTARVTKGPQPDPAFPDRVVVRIKPVTELPRRIPLAEIKADPVLSGMGFVRMPRVAVHAVTKGQWDRVAELTAK
jgi:predicted RNA-binding protein with PUA-like domain